MTVQKIKEFMDEQKSFVHSLKDDKILMNESIIATLDFIKSMLDQLDNDWVDVNDMLPDVEPNSPYKHKYLVTEINGNVKEACFNKYKDGTHRWYIFGISSIGGVDGTGSTPHTYGNVTLENVIAWKPLPDPYKREEKMMTVENEQRESRG